MQFDRKQTRTNWILARRAENSYNVRLRQVARQIGSFVRGFDPQEVLKHPDQVNQVLRNYSDMLHPWARSVARFMLADVARRDLAMWKAHSKDLSAGIRTELLQAPTGGIFSRLMEEQVDLITSMPLDAAERIQHFATESMVAGVRSSALQQEILRTTEVSNNKARLIARTETARAASTFTQARATFAGSEGYIWRTSGDSDVRDLHREMEGKYVRWDTPPKIEASLAPYHAGCGPNCRCYPEPVLPDL